LSVEGKYCIGAIMGERKIKEVRRDNNVDAITFDF